MGTHATALLVDNDPTTDWKTQHYYSGSLGSKAGVGIYVDANPGVVARAVRVLTSTPGWNATGTPSRHRPRRA